MLSSFKPFAKGIVAISIFTFMVNPLLNHLLAPIEAEPAESSLPPFDPSVTDINNYGGLKFFVAGETMEMNIGISYILIQSMPRWIPALMEMINPSSLGLENQEVAVVTNILDARKATGIDFEDSGFTIVDMKEDLSTIQSVKSWRGLGGGIQDFQKKLEAHLFKLLPNASRFEFTYNVIRGGSTFGDQPAAIDGPHLDYSQDDAARKVFHQEYPTFVPEHHALLGQLDTDDEEVTALLGIWKPVLMSTPVCDHPLAVMDARTFLPQHETPFRLHMNFGVFVFHNLNGGIYHDPNQKWYYYPFQNETEVLIFHQYSKGKFYANPHTSFKNPNCPSEGYDSRISVEMRVAVFEKKKK